MTQLSRSATSIALSGAHSVFRLELLRSLLRRFDIDPSMLGLGGIALGVEGADAMLVTLASSFWIIYPLLILPPTVFGLALFHQRRMQRTAASALPASDRIDRVTGLVMRVGVMLGAILLILGASPYAGMTRAREQLPLIENGNRYDYHLAAGSSAGSRSCNRANMSGC